MSSYIDDTSSSCSGTEAESVQVMTKAIIDFAREAQELGLELSTKPGQALVVSNSKSAATKVVANVKKRGLVYECADNTRYLGVLYGNQNRGSPVLNARREAAKASNKKIMG